MKNELDAQRQSSLLIMRSTENDAAIGHAVRALDSFGRPVLGAAGRIAQSDWILVSRINHAEYLAQAAQDAFWIALAGIVLCMGTIAIAAYLRTRQALDAEVSERKAQTEKLNALKLLEAIARKYGSQSCSSRGRWLGSSRSSLL